MPTYDDISYSTAGAQLGAQWAQTRQQGDQMRYLNASRKKDAQDHLKAAFGAATVLDAQGNVDVLASSAKQKGIFDAAVLEQAKGAMNAYGRPAVSAPDALGRSPQVDFSQPDGAVQNEPTPFTNVPRETSLPFENADQASGYMKALPNAELSRRAAAAALATQTYRDQQNAIRQAQQTLREQTEKRKAGESDLKYIDKLIDGEAGPGSGPVFAGGLWFRPGSKIPLSDKGQAAAERWSKTQGAGGVDPTPAPTATALNAQIRIQQAVLKDPGATEDDKKKASARIELLQPQADALMGSSIEPKVTTNSVPSKIPFFGPSQVVTTNYGRAKAAPAAVTADKPIPVLSIEEETAAAYRAIARGKNAEAVRATFKDATKKELPWPPPK